MQCVIFVVSWGGGVGGGVGGRKSLSFCLSSSPPLLPVLGSSLRYLARLSTHSSAFAPTLSALLLSPSARHRLVDAVDALALSPVDQFARVHEIARMDRDGGNYTIISTNAFVENEIVEGHDGLLYLIRADVVGAAIYKMGKDGSNPLTLVTGILGRAFYTLRQGSDGRLYGLGINNFPSDGFYFSVSTNGMDYVQRLGIFQAALQPCSFFLSAYGFGYYSNGAG